MLRYFSYEQFYVIYTKFWKLDSDHDLLISKADLAHYGECGDMPGLPPSYCLFLCYLSRSCLYCTLSFRFFMSCRGFFLVGERLISHEVCLFVVFVCCPLLFFQLLRQQDVCICEPHLIASLLPRRSLRDCPRSHLLEHGHHTPRRQNQENVVSRLCVVHPR